MNKDRAEVGSEETFFGQQLLLSVKDLVDPVVLASIDRTAHAWTINVSDKAIGEISKTVYKTGGAPDLMRRLLRGLDIKTKSIKISRTTLLRIYRYVSKAHANPGGWQARLFVLYREVKPWVAVALEDDDPPGCWVYLRRNPITKNLKIGRTIDQPQRFAPDTDSDVLLELLGVLRDQRGSRWRSPLERQLLRGFRRFALFPKGPGRKEWFSASSAIYEAFQVAPPADVLDSEAAPNRVATYADIPVVPVSLPEFKLTVQYGKSGQKRRRK